MIAMSAAVAFALLALASGGALFATFIIEQRKMRRPEVGMEMFHRHINALNTEQRRESISKMRDETKPHGERRYGS